MMGVVRKRKKNGSPRYHIDTVMASDPASRIRLIFNALITNLFSELIR